MTMLTDVVGLAAVVALALGLDSAPASDVVSVGSALASGGDVLVVTVCDRVLKLEIEDRAVTEVVEPTLFSGPLEKTSLALVLVRDGSVAAVVADRLTLALVSTGTEMILGETFDVTKLTVGMIVIGEEVLTEVDGKDKVGD